jgi:glycosyltransferase involved in cell wall biosynthesis
MRVTIAICTWNRAAMLDRTLESMQRLKVPAGIEWELLVVNNHCTDATDEVIEKHAAHLPLQRIWEPKLGKSNALNTATATATGEWILWTDDDVQVEENWMAAYVDAVRKYPEATYFGGRIDPWFEVDPPAWLLSTWDRVCTAYATRQFGEREFEFDITNLPYGANMAVRTDVQRQYLYSLRLGRVGPNEVRGEETEVLEQMLADGLKGYWIPRSGVRHMIPKERLTEDYLERFYIGIGITNALRQFGPESTEALPPLRRVHYWLKSALYLSKYKFYRRFHKPSRWVNALVRSSLHRGKMSQLVVQSKTEQLRKAA